MVLPAAAASADDLAGELRQIVKIVAAARAIAVGQERRGGSTPNPVRRVEVATAIAAELDLASFSSGDGWDSASAELVAVVHAGDFRRHDEALDTVKRRLVIIARRSAADYLYLTWAFTAGDKNPRFACSSISGNRGGCAPKVDWLLRPPIPA